MVLLEPLISTALAVVVLHERLSPGGAVGGALLLASVVYLYWQQSRLVPVPPPLA